MFCEEYHALIQLSGRGRGRDRDDLDERRRPGSRRTQNARPPKTRRTKEVVNSLQFCHEKGQGVCFGQFFHSL